VGAAIHTPAQRSEGQDRTERGLALEIGSDQINGQPWHVESPKRRLGSIRCKIARTEVLSQANPEQGTAGLSTTMSTLSLALALTIRCNRRRR
jgi:hypothetical protein